MNFQIAFNLYPFNETLFLPSANVVNLDNTGTPAYLVQRALPTTVEAYGLSPSPVETKLMGIIDTLSPKALELKFKAPKAKNPTALAQLLADKDTKPIVERFIFTQLDQFFSEISQHQLPLTLNAQRKTLAKDLLISCAKAPLLPHLFFKKLPDGGVEYRLRLGNETEHWAIHEHNLVPLTNTDPAWLLDGHTLFRATGINGNMVKPFRQKPMVLIPPEHERTYFRNFIAKSIRKSRVEAEGFKVQKAETLLFARLELVEHILDKQWWMKPVFAYEGAEFFWGEQRDRVTSLDIPAHDAPEAEISVRLVCRDKEAEQSRADFLANLGLNCSGKLFSNEADPGLEGLLRFVARHRKVLETAGFHLVPPQIEDKTIALETGVINIRSQATGDWFDVQGEVLVGGHHFPFHRFLPFLRRKDPYFPLSDGTFFLLPAEWFTRWSDLAGAIQEQGEFLRLPKALFTLLQDKTSGIPDTEWPIIDPERVEYQPSENLKATLRPYQLRGVKWLIGHCKQGFGACLADDMGLGKTLQTIATLLWAKENLSLKAAAPASPNGQLDIFSAHREALQPLTALIIMPASLVFNWQRELAQFAPNLFIYAHVGPGRQKNLHTLCSHDVVLTTYHTARQDLALLGKVEWQFIVLDESQQIKNRESEVSKVVLGLRGKHKISLSGTPIENALSDLWTQMEFINPATLGSYPSFRKQFQIPIEKQGNEGAKASLFERVQPFFLRRTKEEVAPELPPLSTQIYYCEMSEQQRKRYEEVKSAVRNEILALFDDPKNRLQALQALMRLRQLACHPLLADGEYQAGSGKTTDVLAQWDLVRRSGHKVLFFSAFEQHLQIFKRQLEAEKTPFAWLTGDTPAKARAQVVQTFQTDPQVQAFLMTLGAGGVGLNLTAADYVFLLDPWWNPAREDQAVARAHRIGQERPVTVLRFISRDTVEEKIMLLQERKRHLSRDLFDDQGEYPRWTREDLEMVLE